MKKEKTVKKLTEGQLRIAVAQDVLSTLSKRRRYTVSGGQYVEGSYMTLEDNLPDDGGKSVARELQKQKDCEVCGLGACFLSLVALDNKFDLAANIKNYPGWDEGTPTQSYISLGSSTIRERLGACFSKSQLDMIECAFEQSTCFHTRDNTGASEDEAKKAAKFGDKYQNDTRRLKAIMQNIIDNEGVFTP